MRKIYLMLSLLLGVATVASAQTYNLTFQVDMSNQAMIADTVSVAGSFQAAAGFPSDWTPGSTILEDPNMDDIYTLTVQVPAGSYEFKYLNGAAWGTDEGVPGACAVNNNRGVTISGDTTLDVVCFGMCTACPVNVDTVTVTLMVDMRNEMIADTVSVAGDLQGAAIGMGWNNWTPGQTILEDLDNDSIYTITFDIPEGTYQYKYINGTAWGQDEGVPAACAVNNNRELVVTGPGPIVIPVHCFAACDTCVPPLPPINVTWRVDMSNEIVNATGLFVAGSFQDPAWVKDVLALTDPDMDGIYEYTQMLVPAEYQYKYYNGNGGDPDGETADFESLGCGVNNGVGGYNRLLDLSGAMNDTILPAYVYNTCNVTATAVEEEKFVDFSIYPNPFAQSATLEYNNFSGKAYDIRVISVTGQVMVHMTGIRSNRVEIARNGMESGMYFVEVQNHKGEKTTRKVIIQ